MRKFHVWLCLAFTAIFLSCAAAPQVRETPPSIASVPDMQSPDFEVETTEKAPEVQKAPPKEIVQEVLPEETTQEIVQETLPQNTTQEIVWGEPLYEASPYVHSFDRTPRLQAIGPPQKPAKPIIPEYIMGKGVILPEDMAAFLLGVNPGIEKEFVENLTVIYMEEAAIEGVNHDTAFAQMCLETGFLRFGGLVTPDMNNFCGLGAIGPGHAGIRFPNPRIGVRAHIQHLKAYATNTPLKQELVDPRYTLVRFGSSPAIKGLAGTWAADLSYAEKITSILERLYNYVYGA